MLNLKPAYGRDYTSRTKLLADFNAGKDFILTNIGFRGYANNEDCRYKKEITFRYAKLRKQFVAKIIDGIWCDAS